MTSSSAFSRSQASAGCASQAVVVRPFEPTDACLIHLQPSQVGQLGAYEEIRNLKYGAQLAEVGPAWTAATAAGDVLFCAGLGEIFPGIQATAWALIADMTVAQKRAVVRAMRPILDAQPYVRIEALAREAHPGEGQFLRMAGFVHRCDLPKWGPLSETHQLYERIR